MASQRVTAQKAATTAGERRNLTMMRGRRKEVEPQVTEKFRPTRGFTISHGDRRMTMMAPLADPELPGIPLDMDTERDRDRWNSEHSGGVGNGGNYAQQARGATNEMASWLYLSNQTALNRGAYIPKATDGPPRQTACSEDIAPWSYDYSHLYTCGSTLKKPLPNKSKRELMSNYPAEKTLGPQGYCPAPPKGGPQYSLGNAKRFEWDPAIPRQKKPHDESAVVGGGGSGTGGGGGGDGVGKQLSRRPSTSSALMMRKGSTSSMASGTPARQRTEAGATRTPRGDGSNTAQRPGKHPQPPASARGASKRPHMFDGTSTAAPDDAVRAHIPGVKFAPALYNRHNTAACYTTMRAASKVAGPGYSIPSTFDRPRLVRNVAAYYHAKLHRF